MKIYVGGTSQTLPPSFQINFWRIFILALEEFLPLFSILGIHLTQVFKNGDHEEMGGDLTGEYAGVFPVDRFLWRRVLT